MRPNIAQSLQFAALLSLLAAPVLPAAILNVPEDYQTIQAAIDASQNGDTVLAAPGVYQENLRVSNRDFTLASLYLTTADEAYVDSTVIDGNRKGSVIYLDNGTDRTFRIVGFTIRNGANYRGGGIYFESYRVVVEHCRISRNRCTSDYGGGICNYWDGSLKLSYCTLDSNKAGYWGGAIFSRLSMTADHCVFSNNSADGYGGAVHLRQRPGGTFTNCVFSNNDARNGGAIQLWAAGAIMDRCTIVNNSGGDSLGGIVLDYGSKVILDNSIVWGNEGYQITCDNTDHRDTVSVSYSDFQDREEGIAQANGDALIHWNDGNFDTDPLFGNPENGDFTLQANSPCIDAGDPDSEPDPDGTRADMGALYYAKFCVVTGHVYDSATNQPLFGATVKTPETPMALGVTDSSGFYLIANVRAALDFSVKAVCAGYGDSTVAGFHQDVNDTLDWDFHLLKPVFTPSMNEVSSELPLNDSATVALTLGNEGNYPLQWQARRHIPNEPAGWSLIGSYPFNQPFHGGRLEGAALAGGKLYVAVGGGRTNQICVLDLDGGLVNLFDQPGTSRYGMTDLTWDGELLWGSGERAINGINTQGELQRQFDGPNPRNQALAYDSDRDLLWIAGITSNRIIGYDVGGYAIMDLPQCNLNIMGLAYRHDDPDDCPLYILSSPDFQRQVLYKMNPATDDTIFVRDLEPPDGGMPLGCEISGEYQQFTQVFLSAVNAAPNDRVDVWFVDDDPTFVSFTPAEGTIDPGASQDMELTLNSSGLTPDIYHANLQFGFPAVRTEAVIPVTMRVKPNSVLGSGFWVLGFGLAEPSPNPFNSQTVASYKLQVSSPVRLVLYDLSGRLVQTLVDEEQAAGEHRVVIGGQTGMSVLPSGIYLLRLTAGREVAVRKVVCVK